MSENAGTAGDDFISYTGRRDGFEFFSGRDGEFEFFFGNDTPVVGAGGGLLRAILPEGSLIDLAAGTIITPVLTQSISGIENLEVVGSGNATLRGDSGDNILYLQGEGGVIEGGPGNDTLEIENISGLMSGGDGDDIFFVGGGDVSATIEGGDGADRLEFSALADDITVSINPSGQRVLSWQTQTVTLLDEVESFDFFDMTLSYADMTPVPAVTGTEAGEVLSGTESREGISALGGNDWITPNLGNDTIDGGAGTDMLSYADLGNIGVNIDLSAGQAFLLNGNLQVFSSIENVTGTSGADNLTGDTDSNLLRGLGGADLFRASGGADRIEGGAGSDLLRAGEFFETIDNDVSVSLLRGRIWEGEGTGTRLASIEHLRTGGGDDMLTGDHGANRLESTDGDDTLMGNGGDDLIYGGFGEDVALFGKNQDQYEITQDGVVTTVAYIGEGVGDGTDLLLSIETLRFADGDFLL
jgi:Ca2+-binding RTX toxin-like protein